MTYKIPQQPENSFRITLELLNPESRLDLVLMEALGQQNDNQELKQISKTHMKKLFNEKRVLIKGQSAKAKSPIHSGITYIDILL